MKYLVYDINYETDEQKVDLPEVLFVETDDVDFLADLVSDETGYLVNELKYEEV